MAAVEDLEEFIDHYYYKCVIEGTADNPNKRKKTDSATYTQHLLSSEFSVLESINKKLEVLVSGDTISLLEPPTVASPIPEDDDPGEGTSGAAGAADEVDEETVSLDSRRFEVSCQMKILIQSTMNSQAIRQLYATHLKRQIQLADLDIEYKRRQMADLSVESEIKRRKLRKLNLEIKKLERELDCDMNASYQYYGELAGPYSRPKVGGFEAGSKSQRQPTISSFIQHLQWPSTT
ncbi:hypothetical protein ABVT39_020404 [Epinephelus coioides]